MHLSKYLPLLICPIALCLLLQGCGSPEAESRQVVIYTAHDRQFSEPILADFEEKTGIDVKPVYDAEAVKTVGLVNRLLAERERPQADIFWNNEIVRSIQLKREGVTESFEAPASLPDKFVDPDGHWAGFAARARVILVNTEVLPDEAEHPTRIEALVDPKWRGRAGFAKPLFGTTSTHAAVMWATDPQAAEAFWQQALDNAVMYAGNAQARDAVADGEIAWCLTDTDDAYGAVVDGKPVRIIYPNTVPGRDGALLLPNTLVRIKSGPNPEEAQALINYLLSEEVEAALAASRSAQIPVREGVPGPKDLPPLPADSVMRVDWEAVADALSTSSRALDSMIGAEQNL